MKIKAATLLEAQQNSVEYRMGYEAGRVEIPPIASALSVVPELLAVLNDEDSTIDDVSQFTNELEELAKLYRRLAETPRPTEGSEDHE